MEVKIEGVSLEDLQLSSRPINANPLSWSDDAELAVACGDCIYVYVPKFPTLKEIVTAAGRPNEEEIVAALGDEIVDKQFATFVQIRGPFLPTPTLNRVVCLSQGLDPQLVKRSADTGLQGVGNGTVTASGGGLNQVARVEWSPSSLGCNLRPVLAAHITNGHIIVLGEHIERGEGRNLGDASRGFTHWKVLWALGGNIPIPDADASEGIRLMDERITSFSWAKEIDVGKALLAYMNDKSDIVIMSVQFYDRSDDPQTEEWIWRLAEVARFSGAGPHEDPEATWPDNQPSKTAFSLKWSPWVHTSDTISATLAYICNNCVAFRRITVQDDWSVGDPPKLGVEEEDTCYFCLPISSGALIEWENRIWYSHGLPKAQGLVSTPFEIKRFEVPLAGPTITQTERATHHCSSEVSHYDGGKESPVTGIIIYPPRQLDDPEDIQFTYTLLSAGHASRWMETRREAGKEPPAWYTKIQRVTRITAPRKQALLEVDFDSEDSEDSFESESEQPLTHNSKENETTMTIHPYTFRIWGIARSPGGGSTVALINKISTLQSQRTAKSVLSFSYDKVGYSLVSGEDDPVDPDLGHPTTNLTAEAKMWEFLYGNSTPNFVREALAQGSHMTGEQRELPGQFCELCQATLYQQGLEGRCENGHRIAICAGTGLAIIQPNTSRVCGVCGLRSLTPTNAIAIAGHGHFDEDTLRMMRQRCQRCGGKYII